MTIQAPQILDTGQGSVARPTTLVAVRQPLAVGGTAAARVAQSAVSVSTPVTQTVTLAPGRVTTAPSPPSAQAPLRTVRAANLGPVAIADQTIAAQPLPQLTSTVVTPSQDPALLADITDGVFRSGDQVFVTSVNNISYNQTIRNINNLPGGDINGVIQFYQGGQFSADPDFYYQPSTGTLTVKTAVTTGVISANTVTAGNVTASKLEVTSGANLGSVNTLTITGGSSNQFLYTNGTGNLGWATISGNSNIVVDNTQINNGNSNVIVNTSSNVVFSISGQTNVMTVTESGAIANLFTSNNYTLGNTTTTISTSRWMDAITTSLNPTVLFTASNAISSVDVHITAVGEGSKQIGKMLSVTQGTTTNYSLYGNVMVGSELAAFTMDQNGGNVRVIATATTANRIDYRLVITLYS
jgi:hypothetical protein